MTILTYQNKQIEQRELDGYVNLTQICIIHNKRLKDFNRSEFYKNYLKALIDIEGADFTPSVTVNQGVTKITWGHPLVALALGQWISPSFHVWCNTHIKTIIEGASEVKTKLQLKSAKQTREEMKSHQNPFQMWCIAHRLNAAQVHDYITESVPGGRKAWLSRIRREKVFNPVGKDKTIGLDCYGEDEAEILELISEIKQVLVSTRRVGSRKSWRQVIDEVVFTLLGMKQTSHDETPLCSSRKLIVAFKSPPDSESTAGSNS